MTNQYDNLSDEQLIGTIKSFEEEGKKIDSQAKIAKNILLERKLPEVEAALKQKPDPFGAVSTQIGEDKVTFTTPKKVEWNQDGLKQLHNQMIADGADPTEYMTVEYRVKEDAYKNWPTNIKEYFEPHRTVKPGNVSIKISPAKEK